jgi:rhodanese-related sulfurtransferase
MAGLLALLIGACGAGSPATGSAGDAVLGIPKNRAGYADVSVEQLATLMDNEELVLVNTHIPYEGELPETDLFIPFDEIADHLNQLPDKDAPIVLYCRSGSMSTTAAEVLVAEGYTQVMELDGGFNAWRSAGYDLVDTR